MTAAQNEHPYTSLRLIFKTVCLRIAVTACSLPKHRLLCQTACYSQLGFQMNFRERYIDLLPPETGRPEENRIKGTHKKGQKIKDALDGFQT